MARKRKKGRKLAKRYGHSRARKRGHSYGEGAASVPVRVHGTLYISPEPLAGAVVEAIEESPQLIEAIVEEVTPEVIEEFEEHDYYPPSRHGG